MPVVVTKQGQSVTIRMAYEGQTLDKSASAAPLASAFLSGSAQSAIPLLAFGSVIARASGLAAGAAAGRTERKAVASVAALSAASGASLAIRKGVASAAGIASVSGAGGAVTAATGQSAGEASAAGVGSVGTIAETVGASTGSAAVAGSGASVFAATGLSEGGSTAAAVYAPPPPAADSWDTTVDTANIAYSNGGRTATRTGGAPIANSLVSFSTGKVYIELTFATTGPAIVSAAPIGESLPYLRAGAISVSSNSILTHYESDFSGSGLAYPAPQVSDVFQMAIDLDNNKFWARNNEGDWNNDASADPGTNTDGRDIITDAGTYWAVARLSSTAGASVTIHGSAATQSYTPPTGFSPLADG